MLYPTSNFECHVLFECVTCHCVMMTGVKSQTCPAYAQLPIVPPSACSSEAVKPSKYSSRKSAAPPPTAARNCAVPEASTVTLRK